MASRFLLSPRCKGQYVILGHCLCYKPEIDSSVPLCSEKITDFSEVEYLASWVNAVYAAFLVFFNVKYVQEIDGINSSV